MAVYDFILALGLLLGTLLIPFAVLYLMLRLKRPAIRVTVSAPSQGNRR